MRFSSQSVAPRAEAIRVFVTARPAFLQAASALAAASEKARMNDTATATWRGMLNSPGARSGAALDLRAASRPFSRVGLVRPGPVRSHEDTGGATRCFAQYACAEGRKRGNQAATAGRASTSSGASAAGAAPEARKRR